MDAENRWPLGPSSDSFYKQVENHFNRIRYEMLYEMAEDSDSTRDRSRDTEAGFYIPVTSPFAEGYEIVEIDLSEDEDRD